MRGFTVDLCYKSSHNVILCLISILQEQYKFVFEAVLMFLNDFDTYSNFQ